MALLTKYTSAGEALVIDVLDGTIANMNTMHVAWGSSASAPAKGQTALLAEEKPARVAAASTQSAADTLQWVGTLTATGSHTISEAGLFTNGTTGTMLMRGNFGDIPVASSDAIEFTFTFQQS